MAKKKTEYVVGILHKGNVIKYVTSIGEHNWANWKDGEEAMSFSKDYALDMCKGFAWNGITAIPIIKLDWINYKNPSSEKEE